MLRISRLFRMTSFERGWSDKPVGLYDRRGRFSLDDAAAALELGEQYVASLYKPLHYTYAVKGQHYPAEQGRSSRPGSLSCSRNRMFPLYRRSPRLQRQLMELNRHKITTDRNKNKPRHLHAQFIMYAGDTLATLIPPEAVSPSDGSPPLVSSMLSVCSTSPSNVVLTGQPVTEETSRVGFSAPSPPPPIPPPQQQQQQQPRESLGTECQKEETERSLALGSEQSQQSQSQQSQQQQQQQHQREEEQVPLNTLRSIRDRLRKFLERQEAIFHKADFFARQLSLMPRKCHLRIAAPEEGDARRSAEKDLDDVAEVSQTTWTMSRIFDATAAHPHQLASLYPQIQTDDNMSITSFGNSCPPRQSITIPPAAVLTPFTMDSLIIIEEEEQMMREKLQQQEALERRRGIEQNRFYQETHPPFSARSVNRYGDRFPPSLDSGPVSTSSRTAALQSSIGRFAGKSFSPSSCVSLSPDVSTSPTRAHMIGLGSRLVEDNLESISVSPLSRPLSSWMESPYSSQYLRREPSFGASLHTSVTSFALPPPPSHVLGNNNNNNNVSSMSNNANGDARASAASSVNSGGGPAVRTGLFSWSCSGMFDSSFNRTPRERSKGPIQSIDGTCFQHLQQQQQQQQQQHQQQQQQYQHSCCSSFHHDSSGSDAPIMTVTQRQQEFSPSPHFPSHQQQSFVSFARRERLASVSSDSISRECVPLQSPAIVPPIPIMRRPPPVPFRSSTAADFGDDGSARHPNDTNIDPNSDMWIAERDFVEDSLLFEDQLNPEEEVEEEEEEKVISPVCRQRLFFPSQSRWRTSRRGRGAREKRGSSALWDLSARFEELEQIRMTNHEALEERELQSFTMTEAGAAAGEMRSFSTASPSVTETTLKGKVFGFMASPEDLNLEVANTDLEKKRNEEEVMKSRTMPLPSFSSLSSVQSSRPHVPDDVSSDPVHNNNNEKNDKDNEANGDNNKQKYEMEGEVWIDNMDTKKTNDKNNCGRNICSNPLDDDREEKERKEEGREENEKKNSTPSHVDRSDSTSTAAPNPTIAALNIHTDVTRLPLPSFVPKASSLLNEEEKPEQRGKKDLSSVGSLHALGGQDVLSRLENRANAYVVSPRNPKNCSKSKNKKNKGNKYGNQNTRNVGREKVSTEEVLKEKAENNNNNNNNKKKKSVIEEEEEEETAGNGREEECDEESHKIPQLLEQTQQPDSHISPVPSANLSPMTPFISTAPLRGDEGMLHQKIFLPLAKSVDADIRHSINTLLKTPIATPRLYLKRTPRSTALPRQASMRSWLNRLAILRRQNTRRDPFTPMDKNPKKKNNNNNNTNNNNNNNDNTNNNNSSCNIFSNSNVHPNNTSANNVSVDTQGNGEGETSHRRRRRLCVRRGKLTASNISASASAGGPSSATAGSAAAAAATATSPTIITTAATGTTIGGTVVGLGGIKMTGAGGSTLLGSSLVHSPHSACLVSASHSHATSPNNHSANHHSHSGIHNSGNINNSMESRGSLRNATGARGNLSTTPTYLQPTESFSRHASGTSSTSTLHLPVSRALRHAIGHNLSNMNNTMSSAMGNNNSSGTVSGPFAACAIVNTTEMRCRLSTIQFVPSMLSSPQNDSGPFPWSPRSRSLFATEMMPHCESPHCSTGRTRNSARSPPTPPRATHRLHSGPFSARTMNSLRKATTTQQQQQQSNPLQAGQVSHTSKSPFTRTHSTRVYGTAGSLGYAEPQPQPQPPQHSIGPQGRNSPPHHTLASGQAGRRATRIKSLPAGSSLQVDRRFSYGVDCGDHNGLPVRVRRRRSLGDDKGQPRQENQTRAVPMRFS